MTCFGSTSETSTAIRLYSRDLYARLEEETGQATGFKPVGLIEAAAALQKEIPQIEIELDLDKNALKYHEENGDIEKARDAWEQGRAVVAPRDAALAYAGYCADLFRERYGDIGYSENELYPGMVESLEALHGAGVPLGICTSKRIDFAERILAMFGIRSLFERVALSGDEFVEFLTLPAYAHLE